MEEEILLSGCGGNEQGETGRGQRQEGVLSVAGPADEACAPSNGQEAAAGRKEPPSKQHIESCLRHTGTQTDVTKGDLSVHEHNRPQELNVNNQQTNALEVHPHNHAPDVKILPPPVSTQGLVTGAPSIFPAALPGFVDQRGLAQTQGTAAQVAIMGEIPSRGRGGRSRGRGRGRNAESKGCHNDVISNSHCTHDGLSILEDRVEASNKRGSAKKGQGVAGRSKQRASSVGRASPDQEFRVPALPAASTLSVTGLNTRGDLPSSLQHGKSPFPEILEQTHAPEVHQHTHAPDTRASEDAAFCTSLPPALCTVGLVTGVSGAIQSAPLHIEKQSRLGDHVEVELGRDSIRAAESTTGVPTSMEVSLSRGRGGRGRAQGQRRGRGQGRGRGTSGRRQEDHTDVMSPPVLAPAASLLSDHTSKTPDRKRGKGALVQGKRRKSSREEATPNHEIKVPLLPTALIGTAVAGEKFPVPNLSGPHGLDAERNQKDAHAPEIRVSETALSAEDSSVCPAVLSSLVEEQSRLGDHVEAPSPAPPSPKGGNLRQELADFLMSTRGDSFRPGDQACKGARKRTKSRKVVENETLWLELTSGGAAVDPGVQDVGKAPEQVQAPSTVCAEESDGVLKEGEFCKSKEGEGLCAVSSVAERGASVNAKASGKKRMRQVLKEHGKFPRPSLQNQGDVMRRLHQAPDIDMLVAQPGSRSRFSSAMDGASANMDDFTTAYGSIEVVEDWHSYCRYAPTSRNFIHVYKDGRPSISSLPLFRASRVTACTDRTLPDYYDLVLNAGGSVWALDWCPQRGYAEGCRREFLAVGAHPHDSPTHRLGEPVQGKGLIQIWALDLPFLSQTQANWHFHNLNRHGRGKQKAGSVSQTRGKRKKETVDDEDLRELFVQDTSEMLEGVCIVENPPSLFLEERGRGLGAGVGLKTVKVESFVHASTLPPMIEEFDLPQMVLGLAHDAGLVWDAKWQPTTGNDPSHLGYLAAVFGDGSMQVYGVPLPGVVRRLLACSSNYSSLTPLVVKMKPVFKCSGLSGGGQISLPLTIEWSSSPHDLVLVGCHDGAVALWRFNPEISCDNDTRPLACFVADTAPIRALAFAPEGSDSESRNIVVTGGHSGRLLFWDLRDPFYPLWDLALSKGGCIFSIDWPVYPRGIVLSMDDGTIRTLGLDAVLCDSPLTGTPPTKTLSQGMHTIFTSDNAIWSVHVSRASGVAVYGGEDGSIVQFQLSEKFFINDRARTKEPHFMCCKLTEDLSSGVLSIVSLSSDAPLQVKNQRADNKQIPLTKAVSRRASGSMNEEEDDTKRKPRRRCKRSLLKGGETDDDEFLLDDVNPLALVPFDPNGYAKPKPPPKSLSTKVGKNSSKHRKVQAHGKPSASSGREAADTLLEGEAQQVNELPPSKAVAVHRIRWNQNRECESLVCFGGAAGIIRCQLIMPRA